MSIEFERKHSPESISSAVIVAPYRVTNEDLSSFYEDNGVTTSSGEKILADQIRATTGICSRYYTRQLNEEIRPVSRTVPELAIKAAQRVLAQREWEASMLDAVYACTSFPFGEELSRIVADNIGADNCEIRDTYGACSGFAYTFHEFAISRNPARKSLFVAAEDYDSFLAKYGKDSLNRRMFGSGAAAMLVDVGTDLEFLATDFLYVKNDAIRMPINEDLIPEGSLWFHVPNQVAHFKMDGQRVLNFLDSDKARDIKMYIHKETNPSNKRKTFEVIHQASRPVIDLNRRQLAEMGIESEVTSFTLSEYGNMAAASVCAEMDSLLKLRQVKKGDLIYLTAYGAGLGLSTAAIRLLKP